MPTVKINPQTWKRGVKIAVPNGRLRRPMNGNLLNVSEKVANFLIERNYAFLVENNDLSENINKMSSQSTESTQLVEPLVQSSESDSSDNNNEEKLELSAQSSEPDSSDDDNEEKLEPYQQRLLKFFNSEKDFSVVKGIGPQTANDILKGQPYTWAELVSTLPLAKLNSATAYLEELNEND